MGHDLVKRIPFTIIVSARKSNLQILSDDLLDNTISIDYLNHIANFNFLHLFLFWLFYQTFLSPSTPLIRGWVVTDNILPKVHPSRTGQSDHENHGRRSIPCECRTGQTNHPLSDETWIHTCRHSHWCYAWRSKLSEAFSFSFSLFLTTSILPNIFCLSILYKFSRNGIHESNSIFRTLESTEQNSILSVVLGRIDPKNLEPLTVHFENRRNHFHNLFLSLSLYIDIIPETSLEIKQNLSL